MSAHFYFIFYIIFTCIDLKEFLPLDCTDIDVLSVQVT